MSTTIRADGITEPPGPSSNIQIIPAIPNDLITTEIFTAVTIVTMETLVIIIVLKDISAIVLDTVIIRSIATMEGVTMETEHIDPSVSIGSIGKPTPIAILPLRFAMLGRMEL